MNEEQQDQLGLIIDEIENLACALEIPLPAAMHVEELKKLLPDKVAKLKEFFVATTGENPWS
jgi:septation ring formation regulator EzrA